MKSRSYPCNRGASEKKGKRARALEADLQTFIRSSIKSVWALELLLLLRKRAPNAAARDDLVRDLRATRQLVDTCITQLQAAGLVACEEGGQCRYAPAAPAMGALADQLEQAYRERPLGVMEIIVSSPNDRLKTFADAFRLKPKDE